MFVKCMLTCFHCLLKNSKFVTLQTLIRLRYNEDIPMASSVLSTTKQWCCSLLKSRENKKNMASYNRGYVQKI